MKNVNVQERILLTKNMTTHEKDQLKRQKFTINDGYAYMILAKKVS